MICPNCYAEHGCTVCPRCGGFFSSPVLSLGICPDTDTEIIHPVLNIKSELGFTIETKQGFCYKCPFIYQENNIRRCYLGVYEFVDEQTIRPGPGCPGPGKYKIVRTP